MMYGLNLLDGAKCTGRRFDPGWSVEAGGGVNMSRFLGVEAQFNFNDLGTGDRLRRSLSGQVILDKVLFSFLEPH